MLQKEEALREVAEIVGKSGLQDSDRLVMQTAETIRQEFLAQNAFTEDAFSAPQATFEKIGIILQRHHEVLEKLANDSETSESDEEDEHASG